MRPEEEDARREMFREIPAEPLQAVAWLEARVAALDDKTKGIRDRHDASSDPAGREALARDLMLGLWMRGTARARIAELMAELAPDQADKLEEFAQSARAEQQIARQQLWGDASKN